VSNRGDLNYDPVRTLYTRADGGETVRLRDVTPPPVDWQRDYGGGQALAEEAAMLVETMTATEAAQELVWRYGRQCEADSSEVRTVLSEQGGDGNA
jgi:hypothetical protein